MEEEAHRPVRRRREAPEASARAAEPLQLVETAADRVAAEPVFEDETPRRPVRRRRQEREASAQPAEPLQLVETQPGAAPAEGAAPQS
jgi:hypothetical protein